MSKKSQKNPHLPKSLPDPSARFAEQAFDTIMELWESCKYAPIDSQTGGHKLPNPARFILTGYGIQRLQTTENPAGPGAAWSFYRSGGQHTMTFFIQFWPTNKYRQELVFRALCLGVTHISNCLAMLDLNRLQSNLSDEEYQMELHDPTGYAELVTAVQNLMQAVGYQESELA